MDLRVEQDEPVQQSVKLMDYLLTQVATKQNQTRWVSRLFVLDQDTLSCFYESAPHLQEEGKNMLTKISIPVKR